MTTCIRTRRSRRTAAGLVTGSLAVTLAASVVAGVPVAAASGSRVPGAGLPAVTSSFAAAPLAAPTVVTVAATLKPGSRGAAVRALQQRLQLLGYWLSAADGNYGQTTQQAVMALQKAAGISRDGIFGPQSQRALAARIRPAARSRSGHVLEIDRTRQILLIVNNGRVESVINTSTGRAGWTTPLGRFRIFRQVNALDRGPLGDLWRPKYFNRGIAIHGSPSIPGYPASHGCARMSNAAINWIWATNRAPIGAAVWVYA
jgi:lipoprotein-anchoring transpeptidase ErfK/SrfK